MADGDVTAIRDEDVLRHMWQQTEDFSKKKEIRAHMYKLREERLRNLYTPEPTIDVKDLKEMSNAGWNVQSENKLTDNGHTNVRTVKADIEGKYDVEGGKGQFVAIDQQMQAATEYNDDNSSLKRNENVSKTAAHEQVVRQTNDGTQISSTTSSSTSSSKIEQTSSKKYETVPYEVVNKKTNKESITESEYNKLSEQGELVSKKIQYPDENTKVIVETRCLPDGTRITSTRKEFRTPSVSTTHSEQHSNESYNERKSSSIDQRSNIKQSSTQNEKNSKEVTSNFDENINTSSEYDHLKHDYQARRSKSDNYSKITSETNSQRYDDIQTIEHERQAAKDINENCNRSENMTKKSLEERRNTDDHFEKNLSSDQYQTTYQSDFNQKKVSTDYSPTHQAWASSLRGDTPSPKNSSRTNLSSTSSLRSSTSPDKGRKPPNRGGSPSKYGRQSPTRSDYSRTSKTYSSTSTIETKTDYNNETKTSNTEKRQHESHVKRNQSPNKDFVPASRPSVSPDRRTPQNNGSSPTRQPLKRSQSPDGSPMRDSPRSSISPDRKPGYMRPTISSQPKRSSPYVSPERQFTNNSSAIEKKYYEKNSSKFSEDHYKFVDEETKSYSHDGKQNDYYNKTERPLSPTLKTSRSPSPAKGPVTFIDEVDKKTEKWETIQNIVKTNKQNVKKDDISINNTNKITKTEENTEITTENKYGTYDKKRSYKDDVEVINNDVTSSKKNIIREPSPVKSTTKNVVSPTKTKYQHASDFISNEITTEEINKHNKSQTRQLKTPSASPTRKSNVTESVPSTGQSSPTTSVSEILYFHSPNEGNIIVTDIDESVTEIKFDTNTIINEPKRPDTLNVKRSPSPSKIPCRSPTSPKEILPKKSALKKPSSDNLLSPLEKPPTTFQISPTVEHKGLPEDNVKDKVEKPINKIKPPLERRETYEERCKKILGMMDDDTITSKSETTKSIATEIKSNVTTQEHEEITEKSDVVKKNTRQTKSHSRETSPTKIKTDIHNVEINTNISEDSKKLDVDTSNSFLKQTISSSMKVVDASNKENKTDGEFKHSRSPSPAKTTGTTSTKECETNEFITKEKEQEILHKVQNSLRKISPTRDTKSPSRERSPNKTTTSLQDIDIKTSEELNAEKKLKSKINITTKSSEVNVIKDKIDDAKLSMKRPTRPTSPIKKPTVATQKSFDNGVANKGTMKDQPLSSPHVPKSKTKEPGANNVSKPSRFVSPTKAEKTFATTDDKKNLVKQNSFSKASAKPSVNKAAQIFINKAKANQTTDKKSETQKASNKENLTPIKDDVKISRTASDNAIKLKKTAPQRMKSKPEIHVSDTVTKTTIKNNINITKQQKPNEMKSKLAPKPKSSVSLNTQLSDRGMIVDEDHAKSSRENSPERAWPTPVFSEEVGTPRLPDEVKEPDDEFQKRTYHTIHETESLVDDIVEISEEEELFTKKTNVDRVTGSDECLLSVNDKVNKFAATIDNINKPKDSSQQFRDIESKVHSDFTTKSSDTVSSKVTKFTEEQETAKQTKITPKNVKQEYDNNTIYQDNYTKLSVNDKTNFFVEAAENVTAPKVKTSEAVQRPDLTNVEESLRSDECLLSVSDKVDIFIKSAEQFLNTTIEDESKERKVQNHEDILKIIENVINYDVGNNLDSVKSNEVKETKPDKVGTFAKETLSSHAKVKDYPSTNLKQTEKESLRKQTPLKSSDAVKKAKALFENIAANQNKEVDSATKLMDIGVIKKSPITDSTTVLHPSVEDVTKTVIDIEIKQNEKERAPAPPKEPSSIKNKISESPKPKTESNKIKEVSKSAVSKPKSPTRQVNESATPKKSVLSRYPIGLKAETAKTHVDTPKKGDTSKIENKTPAQPIKTPVKIENEIETNGEEIEVSTRRGSGKFGVELRKTSLEKSSLVTERRRSSTEHHQPCIEDIFDVDLLEQMLEKVVGYEQRRRIRAQIRIAKKKTETNQTFDSSTYTKSIKSSFTTSRTPEPGQNKTVLSKSTSPERKAGQKPMTNGHAKELISKRTQSPEKQKTARSPTRQPSPVKKTLNSSPPKNVTTNKSNKFTEYATAYMKRVGIADTDLKTAQTKQKRVEENTTPTKSKVYEHTISSSLKENDKVISEDQIDIKETINGKRTPSPQRKMPKPSERLKNRSPSPDYKKPATERVKQEETIIKTVVEKLTPHKNDGDSHWLSSRGLKKTSTESKTFTSKKTENEKTKYRSVSPSKVISKPTDIITSSYGIGPMDADGRPLFGIKALRKGATNYQVRGTVVREEYHSHNGSAPEGTLSVTNYSTNPEELERLLRDQGEPVSRIHGLAAITTTKKFGGSTGNSYKDVHTKEERAAIDQFTHNNRKISTKNTIENITDENKEDNYKTQKKELSRTKDFYITPTKLEQSSKKIKEVENSKSSLNREQQSSKKIIEHERKSEERVESRREERSSVERSAEKKDRVVRQNSIKNLTEKYIKNASDSKPRVERGSYPKAGLILRTGNSSNSLKDLSTNDTATTTSQTTETFQSEDGTMNSSTTRTFEKTVGSSRQTSTRGQSSFLNSSTKVTGVQDILSRMKNADIVIEDGDTTEDAEARALLNKFLGATVLMAGMQGYMEQGPRPMAQVEQIQKTASSRNFDIEKCWDERILRQLLESSSNYEERRQIRVRLRTLMAEQEACTAAVTEALGAADLTPSADTNNETENNREEEEVASVTASVNQNSSESKVSSRTTTTTTSKVIETKPAPKSVSPFAKFRQLEKQNSLNSPSSPKTPQSPSSPGQPYFKFTDPSLQASAATIKERLLQWCRDKTRDYENVKLENFSTSWADGLAFCALVHHFLPNAFDYTKLTADKRRHNFTLAFKVADEKAGIYPLLDVDDMVAMRKPDWKCVFTYVQSIHRRFKDQV